MKPPLVLGLTKWALKTCEVFIALYAIVLYARWGAGLLFGDSWWPLALANTFALYLFLPLPLAVLVALINRTHAWLPILAGIALFAALYGPQLIPRATERPSSQVIRVLTFNAPFPVYGADEAALRDGILRQQADVVFLQELTNEGVQAIQREMAPHYPYILAETEGLPSEGKLILSRYPIEPLPRIGDVTPERAAQRALAHIGGREVVLVNMHPTASAGIGRWQDLPAYVTATYARREREISEVCAVLQSETRALILAGDMNATEQSAAYRLLAQRFGDSWRETGVGFGHTFPAPVFRMADLPFPLPEWLKAPGGVLDRPVPGGLVRLDYIFHSGELRTASVQVVEIGQSDHLSVRAELMWRQ